MRNLRSTLEGREVDGKPPARPSELAGIARFLLRHLRLTLGVALVVTAIGVALVATQPKRYSAQALVMINPRQDRTVNEQQALTSVTTDSAFVDSEIEILRSPDLAGKLVDALKLVDDPEWNPQLKTPGPVDAVTSFVKGLMGSSAEDAAADADSGRLEARIADQLRSNIDVRRRGLTYVMEISASAPSAAQAAQIANRLVALYLEGQESAKVGESETANAWLTERLGQLKAEVQSKEAAVQAYRAEKGLLTAQGISLTERHISEVQSSVVAARADYAEKQAQYEQVRRLVDSGGSVESLANALSSEVIRDLRDHDAEVAQRQADLENRYGPMHPQVEKVRLERNEIREQIQAETGRIATNLKNEAEAVHARLRTLEASLGNVRGNLVSNNAEQVRLNELETDARAASAVYESFLQRFHEVDQQGKLAPVQARVVAEAKAPIAPSSPNLLIGIAGSLFVGICLGIAAGIVVDQFSNTVRSLLDIERASGLVAISTIPVVQKGELKGKASPAQYIIKKPMSAYAEALRVLRTSILHPLKGAKRRVVAVVSALPAEGKTTTAVALARVAALAGKRVILVDCDIRHHSATRLMGMANAEGVVELLSNYRPLAWQHLVSKDAGSDAHILPAGQTAFTPKDIFGSDDLRKLLDELGQAYDFVILDCPPVLAVAESRTIASSADMTVVVCRWGVTPKDALGSAVEQLREVEAKIAGVALNYVTNEARYDVRSYVKSPYYKN